MRLLARMVLIVLLLIVLAACGSDDSGEVQEPPAADTQAVEEGSESDAEDEAAESEAEPASDDMAADADQTDEVSEADSDQETAAEATNDGEAVEMTDEAEAAAEEDEADDEAGGAAAGDEMSSEEPDGAAVEAAADGWGESGTASQSACDHPYMPMREGATWTFDSGDGSFTWEVTSVEGDLEEATATVLVTVDEVTLNYTWNCQSGQGISSFDFAGQGIRSAFPEMTIELENGEGEFLPPAEELVTGHSWTASFDQIVTIVVEEGDESLEMNAKMNTVQNSTVSSMNPVSAAGEMVDGLQIEQVSDITMVMEAMGTSVEQTQSLTNLFDLGRGVGMVHQEVQSEFGPSAVDLVSYFVP